MDKVVLPVAVQDRVLVQTVQPGDSAVAVLGQGGDMPVIAHVVFFVLKTGSSTVRYLDKVVDDFFVQFIKVGDVPVIIQRRVAVLGHG